jgi:hypothetical protein
MTAQREMEGRTRPDLRQRSEDLGEDLRYLIGQDLGVFGIGRVQNGIVMLVVEGMPDEFKAVLSTATKEEIGFMEIAESVPLDEEMDTSQATIAGGSHPSLYDQYVRDLDRR